MRIAAGDKSYSRKIDEILFGHPKIQEAWAIAISNPCRGETVKAFLVLKAGGPERKSPFNHSFGRFSLPT